MLSCPEEEDECTSESEEEKRAAEARVQKIQKLRGICELGFAFHSDLIQTDVTYLYELEHLL